MEIGSSFASGLQGYNRASNRISEESANIAQQTGQQRLQQEQQVQQADNQANNAANQPAQPNQPAELNAQAAPSVTSSLVNMTAELNYAKANVKSIETADEMLGSLIDIRV